ncbi:YceI family protein [Ulvibacter antarcticus]|uniref:YceI-like domain-containing protein n=1 Tax=Ulvibacter antarcticus TaxID=442714 RepID=A0A3L9Z2R5_9FLAO|nr:YceI family protein [Ulvibacter antarcticus]RMA64638.1 YceI-like domain-containing protein [Ulvibacter antarcticus]
MKLKIKILCFLLCLATVSIAQQKYSTKSGEITFEASVPSFEEVKAQHNNVSAVLKGDTGEFAALALIKGFRFKVALMEEHFNENYIESTKFPKATFKGVIKNLVLSDLSEDNTELIFEGTLNLHGVDKKIAIPAAVSMKGDSIIVALKFKLKPEDFDIKIPSIVSSKIAEEVDVAANFTLSQ